MTKPPPLLVVVVGAAAVTHKHAYELYADCGIEGNLVMIMEMNEIRKERERLLLVEAAAVEKRSSCSSGCSATVKEQQMNGAAAAGVERQRLGALNGEEKRRSR